MGNFGLGLWWRLVLYALAGFCRVCAVGAEGNYSNFKEKLPRDCLGTWNTTNMKPVNALTPGLFVSRLKRLIFQVCSRASINVKAVL